jgi:TrmH family RNA methyltransferase
MLITSLQNPRIKAVIALRDRRDRLAAGLTRVEGRDALSLAVASGARPDTLFYCPELFRDPSESVLIDQVEAEGAQLIEVSRPVFEKMAYREGPDGWLATFPLPGKEIEAIQLPNQPFVVVAEAIEKPGNLGAMLRTADAAGVDALISCAPRTDWGNPNIIQASKGAVFQVPVAEASLDATYQWLRRHQIRIVATTPQATQSHYEADLSGPIAVLVGTENEGLSPFWLEHADVAVRIPMVGAVNSLNAATSAALLMYEVVRQRQTRNGL